MKKETPAVNILRAPTVQSEIQDYILGREAELADPEPVHSVDYEENPTHGGSRTLMYQKPPYGTSYKTLVKMAPEPASHPLDEPEKLETWVYDDPAKVIPCLSSQN